MTNTDKTLEQLTPVELSHMREAGRILNKHRLPLYDPETGQPILEAINDEIQRRANYDQPTLKPTFEWSN